MDKETLTKRIDSIKLKIEKIQKRITKWESRKNEESFWKVYSWLENPSNTKESIKERFYNEYIDGCNKEIERANWELGQVKITLDKYQDALNKLNNFNSVEKIPAIWQFLQNWKELVTKFIREDAKKMIKYYELNHRFCERHNSGYYREHPEQRIIDDREEKELLKSIHSLTKKVFNRQSETLVYENILSNELDKEIRRKYERLINDVVAITGEIKNALGLHISPKGELNGLIIGEKGKATIETIGAGGYNIQVFHYRTLIKEIK